jgi:hypothetical protein
MEVNLLQCYATLTGKYLLMFWPNVMPSPSQSSSPKRLLDPEDGNITLPKNTGNYLPVLIV